MPISNLFVFVGLENKQDTVTKNPDKIKKQHEINEFIENNYLALILDILIFLYPNLSFEFTL